MRRTLGVMALGALIAASACGAKTPPRTAPVIPPPPPPPPLLQAHAGADWLPTWPPEIDATPVAALLEEEAETAAPRPAPERPPEPAPPVPVVEPPRLSTPETPDDVAATQQVRDTLERTRRALATLRYDRLSSDARAQYDTVTQLVQQAEEALKARNFVFALKVADKAETLARRLSERAA